MNEIIKEDLRITKTKKALREALLALITEKDFDRISVTEICDKALVNRMTFYKYYDDKFQLLDYLFEELTNTLVERVESIKDLANDEIDGFINIIYETYLFCLKYIEPLNSIAVQCNVQIINTLSKVCLSHIKKMFEQLAEKKNYKYPVDQISAFIFGGFGALLYHWLTHRDEFTPDVVKKTLTDFAASIRNRKVF